MIRKASICALAAASLAACSDSDENSSAGAAGSAMSAAGSGMQGSAGSQMGGGLVSEPCPASAVFCEDFEDDATGAAPGAPWVNSVNGNGSIVVDTAHAVSGANAAKFSIAGGTGYQRTYLGLDGNSDVFPALANEMYGRAMMWLEATPDGNVHWTMIQGEGVSGENDGSTRQYRYGGQQQGGAGLMANYETSPNSAVATDCWDHSAATMPTQQWACVEWRFATETNEMEFWLDGVNLEDMHVTGQGEGCIADDLQGQWLSPPVFERVYLGWERYQVPGNDRNLWIDDVVLSAERIGCAQ